MKLSTQTIGVLQNFATINQSLLFQEGNVLRTVSPHKTILAEVAITEDVGRKFGIYDLNQFLAAVNLIPNATLDLGEQSLNIGDGATTSIEFRYADESMIVTPPAKSLKLPNVAIKFTITDVILKAVMQAARVLDTPEIIVEIVSGEVFVRAGDSKNSSINSYNKLIGDSVIDKDFKCVFNVDNLKIMMLEYDVEISTEGLAKFETTDGRVKYFIATETKTAATGK